MSASSKYTELVRLNRNISYDELDEIVSQLRSGTIFVVLKSRPYTDKLSIINFKAGAWGCDTETHRYLRLTNDQRRKFIRDANAIPRDNVETNLYINFVE